MSPPLTPDADEARRQLTDELNNPAYANVGSWMMRRETMGVIRQLADGSGSNLSWADGLADGTPPGAPVATLRFRVRMPDGQVAVIEEARAGRQRLAFTSLYYESGGNRATRRDGQDGGAGPGTSGSLANAARPALRPRREPGAGPDILRAHPERSWVD